MKLLKMIINILLVLFLQHDISFASDGLCNTNDILSDLAEVNEIQKKVQFIDECIDAQPLIKVTQFVIDEGNNLQRSTRWNRVESNFKNIDKMLRQQFPNDVQKQREIKIAYALHPASVKKIGFQDNVEGLHLLKKFIAKKQKSFLENRLQSRKLFVQQELNRFNLDEFVCSQQQKDLLSTELLLSDKGILIEDLLEKLDDEALQVMTDCPLRIFSMPYIEDLLITSQLQNKSCYMDSDEQPSISLSDSNMRSNSRKRNLQHDDLFMNKRSAKHSEIDDF